MLSLKESITPPATLGVLGGGQLGRMFAQSAQSMGYAVWVLDPDPNSPAGQLANRHICAPYDDAQALKLLAENCAAITTEFENVPADVLRQLGQVVPVAPSGDAVAIAACCHALKSSSHNVGALHLAGVCREIEALCRTAAAAGAALEMSLQDAALRREWPPVVAALAAIREENA